MIRFGMQDHIAMFVHIGSWQKASQIQLGWWVGKMLATNDFDLAIDNARNVSERKDERSGSGEDLGLVWHRQRSP